MYLTSVMYFCSDRRIQIQCMGSVKNQNTNDECNSQLKNYTIVNNINIANNCSNFEMKWKENRGEMYAAHIVWE